MALFAKVVPNDDRFGAYVVAAAMKASDLAITAGGFSPGVPCYIVTDRYSVRDAVAEHAPMLAERGYNLVLLSYREALDTIGGPIADTNNEGVFCFGGDQNDFDSFEFHEHVIGVTLSEAERRTARHDAMCRIIWRVLDYREPRSLDHVVFYVGYDAPSPGFYLHWNVAKWPPVLAPQQRQGAAKMKRTKRRNARR